MSEVKVNKISPRSGTGVQLGDSGDTFTIPSGATILNSGTASGFGDNLEWQSSIVTAATITVVANRGYWLDTSSNAITVTLPGTAAVGDRLIFTDYARNWATNAVTINQNSLKFQGNTSPNPVYNTNGQSVDIVYSGATKGWIPNSDDDVAFVADPSYNAEYLVVAGGAAGSSNRGGGGGAGGYLTNFGGTAIGLTPGTVYTVTVGGGGSGVSSARGNDGVNSSVSGSGLTTITASGGGSGGYISPAGNEDGFDGGSGGGGTGSPSSPGTGGSGTSPQGNNGGAGTASGNNGCGGGGGSASVGSDGSTSAGGNGGNGTQNSITGSAVYYAAGGGGSIDNSQIGGNGGTGNPPGYGEAGVGSATGQNGRPDTGNGAGAADSGTSGTGGGGIIILRVLTSDYSGTTTGSPTVTTDGSHKVIKFTSSGSYTG